MGIREKLNENPAIGKGGAIALTVLAFGSIWYEVYGRSGPQYKTPTGHYFSDDDGATYFKGSLTQLAPFDHDGRQAVAASVFRCKDGKPFVAVLQRYTPKGLQELQTSTAGGPLPDLSLKESEVSLPLSGDKGWMKAGSSAAVKMMDGIKCSDGTNDGLEPVQP